MVAEGHRLQPEAVKQVRVDSFVMETNIHWPTESTLIRDGLRKLIPWCVSLARALGVSGWRQAGHLFGQVKRRSRQIERIASRKGPQYQERLKREYRRLLKLSGKLTSRVKQLLAAAEVSPLAASGSVAQIRVFLGAPSKFVTRPGGACCKENRCPTPRNCSACLSHTRSCTSGARLASRCSLAGWS